MRVIIDMDEEELRSILADQFERALEEYNESEEELTISDMADGLADLATTVIVAADEGVGLREEEYLETT